ncbi:hypothetical protein F652_1399 [Enterobacteriaceae bacterium bta3-1]|nr:hypothetical protein F652_1399 [Enterobacteriaceae bacterium bta3-1]
MKKFGQQKTRRSGFKIRDTSTYYSPSGCARFALFSARFSAGLFNGFFFAFFLLSIPLLILASLNRS